MPKFQTMKVKDVTQMTRALHRASLLCDGWTGLAKALTAGGDPVTKQGVFLWQHRGVPAERALQIEAVTKGAVPRHELRPDLFSGYSRDVR